MALSDSDLELLACMFRRKAMKSRHIPIEAIARLCGTTQRSLKRQLKRLVRDGYVLQMKVRSYSLSGDGIREAKRHLGI
ncbi:MAG: hypothetical protein ACE5H4_04815 [Candidatus Thorarchaeota archaeon]